MKKMVRILCIVVILALAMGQTVFAADFEKSARPPKPTIGVESTNPNFGTSQIFSSRSSSGMRTLDGDDYLITCWYSTISNNGSTLGLYGSHSCWKIVADIRLTLYLQRWNGSSWEDVGSNYFDDIYIAYISESGSQGFQPGYYYRTKAVHFAYNFGVYDTQYSYSSYIYVS